MAQRTGERRDVLAMVVGAVVVLATTLMVFTHNSPVGQESRFFGGGANNAGKPMLPTIVRPNG